MRIFTILLFIGFIVAILKPIHESVFLIFLSLRLMFIGFFGVLLIEFPYNMDKRYEKLNTEIKSKSKTIKK